MRASLRTARHALLRGILLVLLVSATADAADLRGWFVDVGQGDSALFVSPTGKVVLVDAGPAGADEAIREAMVLAGVDAIDLVVLTHAHVDHIGGLRALLADVSVGRVLDPGFMHPSRAYERLLAALEAGSVPIDTARRGQVVDLGAGATMTLLAPRDPLLTGTRSDPNANSIVARLAFGGVGVMLTGDAEAPTETRLLQDGGLLEATVLKVAHHGSNHATSLRFLDAVKPKVGVVSCGRDNNYGHPGERMMERLQARRVPLYRTDLAGTVAFRTDGERWAMAAVRVPVPPREETAPAERVDVNTATVEELVALPGIGPSKAKAIVDERQRGAFPTVDALIRVRGIGPKTLARLRDLVTVGASSE